MEVTKCVPELNSRLKRERERKENKLMIMTLEGYFSQKRHRKNLKIKIFICELAN